MVREIDGCVHGEQNSFGRARFLLTPSLIRATVLEYAFSGGRAMCIAFYSCSLPSLPFLPSIHPAKDEISQLGRYNVVMGCQYNYSLIGSFFF